MGCVCNLFLPHELESSIGRHKGNEPVALESVVPHTWMEGAIIYQARIDKGQQQVRYSAQSAVRRDDARHFRGDDLSILVQYRVDLLNDVQVYFVLGVLYSSLSPRHTANKRDEEAGG